MPDAFNNISIQLLADDETPVEPEIISKSIFFRCAMRYAVDHIVGQLDTSAKKDLSLGELWRDIKPIDGDFHFEIATVLPYYLPLLDSKPDYAVSVRGSELVCSSRMVRCFFSPQEEGSNGLQFYICHRRALPHLLEQKKFSSIHPVPLRSFISKRIRCAYTNAEQAVQEHFLGWASEFMKDIDALINAMRVAGQAQSRRLLPLLAGPSFPTFWLSIEGAEGKHGNEQFCFDVSSSALCALDNLDHEQTKALTKRLAEDESIPVRESALALATTFRHHGYLDLAVVQACIACESVLSAQYRAFLTEHGVSASKYKEAEKDISLSTAQPSFVCNMRHQTHGRLASDHWTRELGAKAAERGRPRWRNGTALER